MNLTRARFVNVPRQTGDYWMHNGVIYTLPDLYPCGATDYASLVNFLPGFGETLLGPGAYANKPIIPTDLPICYRTSAPNLYLVWVRPSLLMYWSSFATAIVPGLTGNWWSGPLIPAINLPVLSVHTEQGIRTAIVRYALVVYNPHGGGSGFSWDWAEFSV